MTEIVKRYDFDISTASWRAKDFFSQGAMRTAHYLDMFDDSGNFEGRYVAKFYFQSELNCRHTCFQDSKTQAVAKWLAKKFNEKDPPKRIDFLDSFVIEFLHRNGRPHCTVEKLLHGKYVKHNNNLRELSVSERYTPQAFSHFTYELTKGRLLVCDIQGVNDIYTDPQILTKSGKEFGGGNLGENGMKIFLRSHTCNPICSNLKLRPINGDRHLRNISNTTIVNFDKHLGDGTSQHTSNISRETKKLKSPVDVSEIKKSVSFDKELEKNTSCWNSPDKRERAHDNDKMMDVPQLNKTHRKSPNTRATLSNLLMKYS